MWTLCRAEWIKTWKRPANWVLAAIVLGIVVISFAALTLMGLSDGASAMETPPAETMMFPHGLHIPLMVLTLLGSIIGIVFMANSVGSEYSGDTWKSLLPRRGNRTEFILSKLASGLLFMVGLIVTTLVIGQLLGFLGVALIGGDLVDSEGFSLSELLGSLTMVFLQVAVYAAITLLVTIVSRSTVVGIVFGVVGTATFELAAGASWLAALILPFVHLNNLHAHWLDGTTSSLAQVTGSFGMEVSAAVSALVIVGYIVGCIAIAVWVFRRRDMAGQ